MVFNFYSVNCLVFQVRQGTRSRSIRGIIFQQTVCVHFCLHFSVEHWEILGTRQHRVGVVTCNVRVRLRIDVSCRLAPTRFSKRASYYDQNRGLSTSRYVIVNFLLGMSGALQRLLASADTSSRARMAQHTQLLIQHGKCMFSGSVRMMRHAPMNTSVTPGLPKTPTIRDDHKLYIPPSHTPLTLKRPSLSYNI